MTSSSPQSDETERLRALLAGCGVGLLLIDARGHIVEANPAAAQVLGVAVDALLDAPAARWFLAGADIVVDDARRAAFLAQLGAESGLRVVLGPTGESRDARLGVTAVRVGDRALLSCVLSAEHARPVPPSLSVTDAERFRRIVESTRDGVWEIDALANTTYVNAPMAAMLGYERQEMVGSPLFDFMDEEGRRISERNIERRRQGLAENHDFVFRRKDGSPLVCELETTPHTDADGRYAGSTAIVREVGAYRATVESLREAEARSRFFIDASLFGIWLATLDRPMPLTLPIEEQLTWFLHNARLTLVNDTMGRMFGVPSGKVLEGLGFIDVWRQNLDRYFAQTRLIAEAGWAVDGLILENHNPAGQRYFVRLTSTPHIVDGHLVQFWAALGDVTAIQEADERYRLLADEAPLGLLILTQDLRIEYANDTFARLVGRSRDELVTSDAETVQALVHIDDRQVVQANMAARLAGGSAEEQYEVRFVRPDGEVRVTEVYPRAIQHRGRRAVHIAAIDVTERRQAELKLHASESRYRAVVEGAEDAIFVVSRERIIIDCNPAACRLLGVAREHLIGRETNAFYRGDESQDELARVAAQHERNERAIERRIKKASGEVIDIEVSLSHLADGFQLAIVRDIGVRKRTQRAINSILEATVGAGDAFFRALVKNLCSVLGARVALIGRIDEAHTVVDVQACWRDGEWLAPFTYPLVDTPCDSEGNDGVCFFETGVAAAFPRDRMLQELRAESYLGMHVHGDSGQVLGMLAVIHDAPIDLSLLPLEVLQVFAARAAAELDRAAALDALRRAESRWRSLISSVPDYIALVEPDLRVAFVNRADNDYTPEEAVGTSMLSWWTPEDHATILATFERAMNDHVGSEFEGRVAVYDPPRRFSCVVGPILHDGKATGVVLVARDVHERRLLEEREHERDVLLRGISAAAPVLLYVYDRVARRTIFFNRSIATVLGYPASAPGIGDAFPTALVHPDDRAITRAWHDRWARVSDGEVIEMTFRVIAADGAVRWYRTRDVAFKRDASGEVVQVVGSGVDISERLAAENARNESEERFRRIIERTGQVVYERDVLTNTIAWGGAYERVLGIDPRVIAGVDHAAFERRVHPEDLPAAQAGWERCIAAGMPGTLSYRFERENGSYVTLEDRAVYLAPADDRPGRLLGAISDVSEARRLENQLRASQRLESVGRLAGGVAHDFNNLLTAVLGYAELALGETPGKAFVVDCLEQIRAAARRGASLTSQLLAFARKQVIAPRVVDINALVRAASGLLAPLIGEHIETAFSLSPTLGRVLLDPSQFEQVLVNLAVNARDAMPKGGRLLIETHDTTLREGPELLAGMRPGPYVVLAISDTGHGMEPEVRQRAFEPFFTTKGIGRGTGLGLATCYGIVTQAGGGIEVLSEPGEGTTFKVYLPRVSAPLEATPVAEEAETPKGFETLLLVEDDAHVRRMALSALRSCGFRVLEATDGVEGLELARAHGDAIALVVSDVVMPRLGGHAMVAAIRAFRPDVKVLFMSGYSDDAISDGGILQPGIAFLQKPFTLTSLASRVRSMLDQQGSDE